MKRDVPDHKPDYLQVTAFIGDDCFNFRCPFCQTTLRVLQIAYLDLIACPKCTHEFLVATEKQVKAAKQQAEFELQEQAKERERIQQTVQQLRLSGAPPPDRISIFGVSSSGKSVYLASLYDALWNGRNGLSGRAVRGDDHEHLLGDFAMLRGGAWPDATTSSRRLDILLHYEGIKATLSSADYPGEVFTDVFFRKRQDSPDRIELLSQLQSSLGAILLVDPEQAAAEGGRQQRLDVEYTGIEVAEQLASRNMLEHFVVVLTKKNQNKALVREHGGPRQFVSKFLPRLNEAAPEAPILHISAIGVHLTEDMARTPTIDAFDRQQVLTPLTTLLTRIDKAYLQLLQDLDREAIVAANTRDDQIRSTILQAPPPSSPKAEVS